MKPVIWLLALCFVTPVLAESELEPSVGLPTPETPFLDVIGRYSQKAILEILGDPTHQADIRHKKTGEIIGSAWYYSYLNTDDAGNYYQTTELDFIEEQVITVVFMNNDGLENSLGSNKY